MVKTQDVETRGCHIIFSQWLLVESESALFVQMKSRYFKKNEVEVILGFNC